MVERSPVAHGLKNSPNMPEGNAGLCAHATTDELHRAGHQSDLPCTEENITNLGENHIKYVRLWEFTGDKGSTFLSSS